MTILAGLSDVKTVRGYIVFTPQYKFIVSRSATVDENFESSSIDISRKYFTANLSANINLTKTNEVVNSINNGTITGTFNKYSWGVNGLDFEQDSLVFSVYANQNFEYYPQIDLILEYSGTGYEMYI